MPNTKSFNQKKEYNLRRVQEKKYTKQLEKVNMNSKANKKSLKDVLTLSKHEIKKLMNKNNSYEQYSWYLETKLNNIAKIDSC